MSIDYEEESASNRRSRNVLGDITSVHNTQRNDSKKGGKASSNRKLRKTGDGNVSEENGILTRSRSRSRQTRSRRRDVAMGTAESEMGMGDLSLAMEDDSEGEDSSSSATKPSPSMQVASPTCDIEPLPPLGLWDTEEDPCYEYADEIYLNLKETEVKFRPVDDYMTTMQSDINHTMRSILVDWLVEVGEEYKLSSQTLFLTINYIDRLLSKVQVNRSKLQLLGITCMLIAAKYEEIYPPSIDEFVYISDNTYTRQQVLNMEGILLTSLKFHLSAATPWEFCRRFCKAIDANKKTSMLADFLCEVFLLEPNCLKYSPSMIASASIFVSLYTLNYTPWTPTLVRASGYEADDLMQCANDLLTAHQKMCGGEQTSLKAIREKYKEQKFANVSTIPPKAALNAHIFTA